jgi:hypothetical protein
MPNGLMFGNGKYVKEMKKVENKSEASRGCWQVKTDVYDYYASITKLMFIKPIYEKWHVGMSLGSCWYGIVAKLICLWYFVDGDQMDVKNCEKHYDIFSWQ